MRKFFCTFGDARLRRSLGRISRQAESMAVYDRIVAYSESDLSEPFRQRFADRLQRTVRGFGYWVWKPQVVLQTMQLMEDGDILHYADSGCWLNPRGRTRLLEYFAHAENAPGGVLPFSARNDFHAPELDFYRLTETSWSKDRLLRELGVLERPDILETTQLEATTFFIRKTPESVQFVQDWISVFERDFSLVDDTPSENNAPGFIANRHDQSVFSILGKLRGFESLSSFEFFYPIAKDDSGDPRKVLLDWTSLANYPIWKKMDKDMGLFLRVYYKSLKLLGLTDLLGRKP